MCMYKLLCKWTRSVRAIVSAKIATSTTNDKKVQQSWQTSALFMHLPLARLVSMPVIFCLLPCSSIVILVFLPCDAVCTVLVIVILSVRLSVRPSVTLVHCVHMIRPTTMISSPYGSLIILVSGIPSSSQNSKGITPSEGVEWGWGGY